MTPEESPQQDVPNPKIRCVLDPSRRERNRQGTHLSCSWFTATDLELSDVDRVLKCKGLKGYVFPQPKKDAVRIYDWVSNIALPSLR